jgi:hypothetical protein
MRRILAIAGLAAMSLAACSKTQGGAMASSSGDSRLCIPFATTTTTTTTTTTNGQAAAPVVAAPIASDPGVAVEDCLHRWGYALAASADEANQVATATVAACGSSISRWNQQTLTGGDGGGPPEAPSLLTGQPTTPITEHFIFAQGRALFYVVQARAGKCTAPPISNGVPVGVALN